MSPTVQPAKRRRWRRSVVLAVLVVAIVLAGVYRFVTDPERLRRSAIAYLQKFFDTPVSVDAVAFSLRDGLRVTGVAIADVTGDGPPLFDCDEIRFEHRPAWLLVGRFKIDAVRAQNPTLRAVFDGDDVQFNLQRALRDRTGGSPAGLPELPKIDMPDARTLMYRRDGGELRLVQELHLRLIGEPLLTDPGAYDVTWREIGAADSTGRVRLKRRRGVVADVDGGTPWLSIEAATFIAEAAQPMAADWIQLLGVRGRFRIRDYMLALNDLADRDRQITVEFTEASLSIPIDDAEDSLSAAERYLRLEDVAGYIRVGGDQAIAEVQGLFHGAACSARATLTGAIGPETVLTDLAFELDVELRDWTLPRRDEQAPPAEARFVNRWRRLRHFYRDFDPHGRIDATIAMGKTAGPDEPLRIRQAVVEGRGCDAAHRFFPYRVHDIIGQVLLDESGIHVQGLTGKHAGGVIVASGWVERLSRTSASELYFRGDDIALDEDLCFAIGDRHRRTWEDFNLDGLADIEVWMNRPASTTGVPGPWAIDISADLHDASAMFEGFPYRVDELAGRIEIYGDTIGIDALTGSAGGSDVEVSGVAVLGATSLHDLDLRVDAFGVLLDNHLLAALPADTRRSLERMSPVGRADIFAQLSWDQADDKLDYDLAVALDDVAVVAPGWPVRVAGLHGDLAVGPGRVGLDAVRGRIGSGTIEVQGHVADPNGIPTYDLQTSLRQVSLNEEVRGALPEAVQKALAEWTIDGAIDADVRVSADPKATDAAAYAVLIRPQGATVTHATCPVPLRIEAGEVRVDGRQVRLDGVRAVMDKTTIAINGSIDAGEPNTAVDLTFDIESGRFTEALREALPWRLRRMWNDLQPSGGFAVRDGHLTYSQQGEESPRWSFSGTAVVVDAGFDAGVAFRNATGTATLRGIARGTLADASLDGELAFERVDVQHWRIDNLRGSMAREGSGPHWRLTDLWGEFYGGEVEAAVEVRPAQRGLRYDARVRVRDAAIDGVVSAGPHTADEDEQAPLPGVLAGHCYLSGEFGDVAGRQGSGAFAIADAELYRLPLLLAVLQVINLAPPERSAFQSAHGPFFILGDTIVFRDLLFQGSALALIGHGTMEITSRDLDMEFVAVSPHRWAEAPLLTELIEGAARELVTIQVTGKPGTPKAVARPLRRFDDALRDMLTPPPAEDAAGDGND